jgi:uncharacterized protein YydD (DUF2326 family)
VRLISLTSNSLTFHPIKFNPTGLSLIVGKQKNPELSDKGRTYNGVGKSLALALVHYCLGSSTISGLKDKLPKWEFSLDFEVHGKRHLVTRNTSNQSTVVFDGEQMSQDQYRDMLRVLLFPASVAVPGLRFRSLFPAFARSRKESYVTFDTIRSQEPPYMKLLRSSYLLGLDIGLVTEKHHLKAERDRIAKLRENISNDTVFIEFFTDNKNIEIELRDLDERIAKLEYEVGRFQVAENYYEIETEANDAKRNLQRLRNQATSLRAAIANINQSLELRPDVSASAVLQVYNEAMKTMPSLVTKRLEEVSTFHQDLVASRIHRLSVEKSRIQDELKAISAEIDAGADKLNSLLSFLGTHSALDELIETTNFLSDLRSRAQKIRDYEALLERYSIQTQEINIALSNETIKANGYLKERKNIVDSNFDRFRSLSRRFYPDRPGGLTVKNNEGDNQIRFDVDAKIQDDASDGINEVKIFCYDMALLLQRHNHAVNFLWHDSRLFSDMDPRQRATLFELADEHTKGTGQYIATMNEDQIESMRDQFTDDVFDAIIGSKIVLELTDDSPEGKLLGLQVDMQYY